MRFSLALFAMFLVGCLAIGCTPSPKKPATPIVTPKMRAWEAWVSEHMKTCPTCKRAWESADSAMCIEAFERMQDSARED